MPLMRRTRLMCQDGDRVEPLVDPEFRQPSPDGLVVRLQTAVYSAEAIAAAAHRFTDRCFVHLEHQDDEHVVCRFRARHPDTDLSTLAGEFTNEVLDQVLRARLARETEQLR